MISPETIKIIIAFALFLHGIAHGKAFIELLIDAAGSRPERSLPVRSWLFPSFSRKTTAVLASVFWLLSTVGFIAAALAFWRNPVPDGAWMQWAVIAAIISTLGIVIFSGIWPGAPSRKLSTADTIIALVVNGAILIAFLLQKLF